MLKFKYKEASVDYTQCSVCNFFDSDENLISGPVGFGEYNKMTKDGLIVCVKCLESLESTDIRYSLGIMASG